MEQFKYILMMFRIFYTSRSAKKFWSVFGTSMVLSLVILYIGFTRYVRHSEARSVIQFQKNLMFIFQDRPRKETSKTVDYTNINLRDISINDSQYLWEPNAIHYRYLLPKDGHPKGESQKE